MAEYQGGRRTGRQGGTAATDCHGGVRGGEGEARPRAAADLSLPRTADQNGAADGAGRRGLQRRGRRRGEAWTAEVGKQSRGGPEWHGERRGGGADGAGRRGGRPDEQGGAVDEQMRRLWIGKGATER